MRIIFYSVQLSSKDQGMEAAFVQGKLGEPWAKEDPYATGSGTLLDISIKASQSLMSRAIGPFSLQDHRPHGWSHGDHFWPGSRVHCRT